MSTLAQKPMPIRQSRKRRLQAKWRKACNTLGCPSLLCGFSFEDALSTYSEDLENEVKRSHGSAKESGIVESKTTPAPVVVTEATPEEEPSTQKALLVARKGEYEICQIPIPHVGDHDVMIRTVAVGLNPIDWKSVDYNFCLPEFPWITGREMSGVVTAVGKSVKKWKAGDKVWTSTYYRDKRAGCFQELVVVPEHTVNHIPSTISFEEAACFGVAALTASMTLWRWLGASSTCQTQSASTQDDPEWLLIWGGSTVTGQFLTQLAVQSGLKVITVNSQETKNLSLRLGASHVVIRDGKTNEDLVEEIRRITATRITRVIDLVGPKTAAVALEAVSTAGSVEFAPLAMMAKDQAVPENVNVHTVEMKQYVLDPTCEMYAERLNELVRQKKITLPEMTVLRGGIDDIIGGLDLLKKGNMGGKKLIVAF